MYVFRAESSADAERLCGLIRSQVRRYLHPMMWRRKTEAAIAIDGLMREQFVTHMLRYQQLLKSLAKHSFAEDELPITSTRKEKSGVLSMETPWDANRWRDFYFVLFEGALFYYKDSKSTTPTGFVTLKTAAIIIDANRIARGEFVFHVVTPIRSIVCKTKHAVALSEWVSCLENTLNASAKQKRKSSVPNIITTTIDKSRTGNEPTSPQQQLLLQTTPSINANNGGSAPSSPAAGPLVTPSATAVSPPGPTGARRNSLSLLHDLHRWTGDISSLRSVIYNPTAVDYFRRFLFYETNRSINVHALDFFVLTQFLL